ncbi:MAG: hypothetical protein JNL18_18070 [Planctomycetaceae bacterium]|nr:hypothetical protein [Planctomycetaceae bacterium]
MTNQPWAGSSKVAAYAVRRPNGVCSTADAENEVKAELEERDEEELEDETKPKNVIKRN